MCRLLEDVQEAEKEDHEAEIDQNEDAEAEQEEDRELDDDIELEDALNEDRELGSYEYPIKDFDMENINESWVNTGRPWDDSECKHLANHLGKAIFLSTLFCV